MSTDAFDEMFAGRGPKPFTDRVGRADDFATNRPTDGSYRPYGFLPASGISQVCEVSYWMDHADVAEGIAFQYRFLMSVRYTGHDELRLMLPDCVVVIEGHKLNDLRERLGRQQVTFIQEYSPRIWPTPPANDAPVVLKVRVVKG